MKHILTTVLFMLIVGCASRQSTQLTSPPTHEFNLAVSDDKVSVEIDLSNARDQLREVATNNAEVLYFYVRNARCLIKPPPSLEVYLSGTPNIELVKSSPYWVGDLKFSKWGAFEKGSRARVEFAVNKSCLRAIAMAGGRAVATFVVASGGDSGQLADKPISLSDIGFEVQRIQSSGDATQTTITKVAQ